MLLTTLFELPAIVAFDVDDEGRLLVGADLAGDRQVYLVEPGSGWRVLTSAADTARNARFVPGSRQVVVEHDRGGDERGQLSLLELDDRSGPEKRPVAVPLVHDPAYFHRLVDVKPGRVLFLTNRRNSVDFDLISYELSSGGETVLYEGGGYIFGVYPSPDDRWLVLSKAGGPGNSIQLLLADTSTGTITELTDFDDASHQDNPSWFPDSSGFVVATDALTDRLALRRYDLARGWSDLRADDDRDLHGFVSPDGEHLLIATTDDGVVALSLHTLTGEQLTSIGLPAGGCAARQHNGADPLWSPSGSHLALTYSSPQHPMSVYRYTVATRELVPIDPPELPPVPAGLPVPESHRVESFDGEQVPVFVYRPIGPASGSAVLYIHGGPEGASMRTWLPIVTGLAAEGHTVVVPNVRGSAGYGRRWYALDDRELRLDSVRDLAAIHAWLPTIGVDQTRVALYGGSYGGYMVLAGLAFQPELWAAGVDIVGIASLVTFLENTSSYRRTVREREYGYLATDREFLEAASPLNRVDEIRAPLFVIHGANDPRVPLSEAEQIVAACEKRGVPCRLLVYPDEGHGLAKRANRLDAYPQAFSFLREHLSSGQPGWTRTP